jgi:hypothetical protein
MFEEKNGIDYKFFRGINKDSFSWKPNPIKLRTNAYDMEEISIDLSDVTLKGSSNSITKTSEVLSSFRVIFDANLLR